MSQPVYGLQHQLCANDTQIHIISPGLFLRLQTHLSNFLLSSPLEYQVDISNVYKCELPILPPKLSHPRFFKSSLWQLHSHGCSGQKLESFMTLLLFTLCILLVQETVLAPPSKYIQYSSMSHILHCYHPNRCHHDLSTEILQKTHLLLFQLFFLPL